MWEKCKIVITINVSKSNADVSGLQDAAGMNLKVTLACEQNNRSSDRIEIAVGQRKYNTDSSEYAFFDSMIGAGAVGSDLTDGDSQCGTTEIKATTFVWREGQDTPGEVRRVILAGELRHNNGLKLMSQHTDTDGCIKLREGLKNFYGGLNDNSNIDYTTFTDVLTDLSYEPAKIKQIYKLPLEERWDSMCRAIMRPAVDAIDSCPDSSTRGTESKGGCCGDLSAWCSNLFTGEQKKKGAGDIPLLENKVVSNASKYSVQ